MKIAKIFGQAVFGFFVLCAIVGILQGTYRMDIRTIVLLAITLSIIYVVCMIPYYIVKGYVGAGKRSAPDDKIQSNGPSEA